MDYETNEKSRWLLTGGLCGSGGLLPTAVRALARVVLGGLNPDAVLLGVGRYEAPDAVRLPIGGLHDLGEQMHLGRRMSRYVSA